MTETETITVPVGERLRRCLLGLAARTAGGTGSAAVSRTAQRLVHVGLGAERAGTQVRVQGPLGVLPRPFSRVATGETAGSVTVELEAATVADLRKWFDGDTVEAAWRALRLGVFVLDVEDLPVRGPLGAPRPFAKVSIQPRVVGERAETALADLQMRLRTAAVTPVTP